MRELLFLPAFYVIVFLIAVYFSCLVYVSVKILLGDKRFNPNQDEKLLTELDGYGEELYDQREGSLSSIEREILYRSSVHKNLPTVIMVLIILLFSCSDMLQMVLPATKQQQTMIHNIVNHLEDDLDTENIDVAQRSALIFILKDIRNKYHSNGYLSKFEANTIINSDKNK